MDLNLRVGIYYGKARVSMLGNYGNQRRSIIDQSVNVTSRVEAANKEAGTRLLVLKQAHVEIKDRVIIEDFVRVKSRGVSQRSTLYEVTGVRSITAVKKMRILFFGLGLSWVRIVASKHLCVGDNEAITLKGTNLLIARTENNISTFLNNWPRMNLPLQMG